MMGSRSRVAECMHACRDFGPDFFDVMMMHVRLARVNWCGGILN